ncbi:PQQ-dependent sugar dehydrogenase [Mariniflexile sp. HNIBRBA6329]|uniref:PQQ-dependent sugar dehydrogenase n=1 Tax=Mariniflexile sp. HNIBRBA6329 TaxID=3373088 RepID=UPI0037467C6A
MKNLLFFTALFFLNVCVSQTPVTSGADWAVTILANNSTLLNPNTIIYGPDGYLWITERVGKKVVKISPSGGTKIEMLDLSGVVYQSSGQNGLMGMTVHPDLFADINTATNNYVYLLYTYNSSGTKFRIARYTYNVSTGKLNSGSATTIIDGIEASNDHNSGKIVMGPDLKLYWTIGEFANNRGSKACFEIRSQYLPTSPSDYSDYKGKMLRLNLDGSIPSDNPMLDGVVSHVFSYGHRNAQGLVFGSNGKLYSSEHGDKTDDEINIIESGKNYGWPLISGYNDDKGYAYCNWSSYPASCGSYSNLIDNCPGPAIEESTSAASMPNFMPPIGTLNTTPDTEPTGGSSSLWPTVAPSSIAIYEGGKIPDWGVSLLIPTLKGNTIFRTKLNADGSALEDGMYEEFHSSGDRFRDVAVDPNGIAIYTVTDAGALVKLQFVGTPLSNSKFESISMLLVPNPASTVVKLSFNSKFKSSLDVVIIDSYGRTIKEIKKIPNNYLIDTSKFSNGVYFISVLDNDKKVLTKKVIIQR